MHDDLARLADDFWEHRLSVQPTTALMLGDHRFDAEIEDLTRDAEDAHLDRLRDFADAAEAIDPATLDADERVTRGVLMFEGRKQARVEQHRPAELAVNHTIGMHLGWWNVAGQIPLTEAAHADAMVEKYRAVAGMFDQAAVRLQEGVAAGRTPPRIACEQTIAQIDRYVAMPVDVDPFLQINPPPVFDADQAAAWKGRLAGVVEEHIRPAYARYRDVIAADVLPAARPPERSGLSWLADGAEYYAAAIDYNVTLPLSAEEIHQVGLDTVAALEDEYRDLGGAVLGTTDVVEIYARLRDDPELHHTSGADLVEHSERAMAKAKAAMGDWFGRLPGADCIVREVEHGPTAFYMQPATDGSRPGTFFINTADPTRWGRFEVEAMAYHEGIPGHHLQLAIAQELDHIPDFRKHSYVTAYSEGWGLYTERLAEEMGLYSTDLDRIGMLSADSMRACRLVVDTGLHGLGWSRQQAVDYMLGNSPMSQTTVEGEVDRYIGMPGQALAYMMGRIEIQRLRAEAEADMGDRFDVSGFHDTVLGSGPVPLDVLGGLVRAWAAA